MEKQEEDVNRRRRRMCRVEECLDLFPIGIRFIPTDEELVCHYLMNKVFNKPIHPNIIHELDIYNYNPNQLAEMYCKPGEEKIMYFFSRLVRKNQNAKRPSRTAGDGYWKATRGDRPIPKKGPTIGYAKSLVYYRGKPSKEANRTKTNYLMQEYIINRNLILPTTSSSTPPPVKLDDWVLCKVYEKVQKIGNRNHEQHTPSNIANTTIPSEGCTIRPFPTLQPNQLPPLLNSFVPLQMSNTAPDQTFQIGQSSTFAHDDDLNFDYTRRPHEFFDNGGSAVLDGSVGGSLANDGLMISDQDMNLSYTVPNEGGVIPFPTSLPSQLPPPINNFDPTTRHEMSNTALQFHSGGQSSTYGHDDLILNNTIPEFSDNGFTAQPLSLCDGWSSLNGSVNEGSSLKNDCLMIQEDMTMAKILEILELQDLDFSSFPKEGCPDTASLYAVPDRNIMPSESHALRNEGSNRLQCTPKDQAHLPGENQ